MRPEQYLAAYLKSDEREALGCIVALVRYFQAGAGLRVDGKLGPLTRAALAEERDSELVAEERDAESVIGVHPESTNEIHSPVGVPSLTDSRLPNIELEPQDWQEGIDVSRFQRRIDWVAARQSGVKFAFAKASEGKTYQDPLFVQHWSAMKQAGLLRGAYHFMRPDNNSAQEEAENVLQVIGKLGPGDLPIVGDLEVPKPKRSATELSQWVNTWCAIIEERSGRTPILYTHASYWIDQLNKTSLLKKWPLWLADYRTGAPNHAVADLGGWPWLMWQWTGKGRVAGYSGDIDRNVFRGTEAQLRTWAAVAESAEPRPIRAPALFTNDTEAESHLAPLRVRALNWCLTEAERWGSSLVSPERVAEYLSGAVRAGKRLGLTTGNFCAAAQGFAEAQVALPGEVPPPWRVGSREPMADAKAKRRGTWHPVSEVRDGHYVPPPGALAIYWRGAPGDWRGHIERVVEPRGGSFLSVGANEGGSFGSGGRWVIEETSFSHPKLLGFVVDDDALPVV